MMEFERIDIARLLGANPRHPFWALGEAIRREAFFQREIEQPGFTKRELYMMADIAYRPGQNLNVINAVEAMLDRRGVEK